MFDFDGTICDSVDVKTAAFHELYRDEQGQSFANRVRDYHLAHQGTSRYDKIEHVERAFLGNDGARVPAMADRFSSLVEDAVVAAPVFARVVEFLRSAHSVSVLAIASATPTDELRRIVERKALDQYFAAVEGSPRSKAQILAGLSRQFDVDPVRMIMVGDQPSDAHAAEAFGIDAAIIGTRQAWNAAHPTFPTFSEVARWLEEHP